MKRALLALVVALLAALGGCSPKGGPEAVADAFVDAYFVRVDQEKAKEFTALTATRVLDEELRSVADVRKEGYDPNEARGDILVRRGDPTEREQRVRIPYQIVLRADGVETIRDADVELAQIQGLWKVVRFGVQVGASSQH